MTLCANAGRCGGCYYQGIPYEEQLETKEQAIRKLLDPVVRNPYLFESIIPSPLSTGYRNKMEFSFGDEMKDGPLTLGLHQKRSFYNIINTDDCQLPHQDFCEILKATRSFFSALSVRYYHKASHTGYLRHLLIRRAIRTGEILVDLITTTQTDLLPDAEAKILSDWRDSLLSLRAGGAVAGTFAGILHTRNDALADAVIDGGTETLYGENYFYEELLGLRFRISPFSFFQTNSLGAEKLYSKIREYADAESLEHKGNPAAAQDSVHTAASHAPGSAGKCKPVIYDLYSGTGTITQLMSPAASLAVGVEIVPEAVAAARENVRLNGISNCDFIAGDVLKVITDGGQLVREDGSIEDAPRPDLIILDPPRDGIQPKALRKIMDYGVDRLIYVACKPASLARDLIPLQNAGYRVEKVCPVDMFPQTNNCECICLMTKTDLH